MNGFQVGDIITGREGRRIGLIVEVRNPDHGSERGYRIMWQDGETTWYSWHFTQIHYVKV